MFCGLQQNVYAMWWCLGLGKILHVGYILRHSAAIIFWRDILLDLSALLLDFPSRNSHSTEKTERTLKLQQVSSSSIVVLHSVHYCFNYIRFLFIELSYILNQMMNIYVEKDFVKLYLSVKDGQWSRV